VPGIFVKSEAIPFKEVVVIPRQTEKLCFAKPDYSSGFIPPALSGIRDADGMTT
jgi:hypothetical protein